GWERLDGDRAAEGGVRAAVRHAESAVPALHRAGEPGRLEFLDDAGAEGLMTLGGFAVPRPRRVRTRRVRTGRIRRRRARGRLRARGRPVTWIDLVGLGFGPVRTRLLLHLTTSCRRQPDRRC